jgi:hypothetical protein
MGRGPNRPLRGADDDQRVAAQAQQEPRRLHRLAVGVHRARHQP